MINAKRRADKWKAKLSGDNRKRLYDSQKERMVKLETIANQDFERIEKQIKIFIQGQPIYLHHFYMAFAKEIYSKRKKFKHQTLINEIVILENKWRARGLDDEVLVKIKRFYVQAYGPIADLLARFDVGRFDLNTFG